MTEPKPSDCYAVATKLPNDIEVRAIALFDESSRSWKGIGDIVNEALEQIQGKHSKKFVYQRLGNLGGKEPRTVEAWGRYRRDLGDWMDEMPFPVSIEQIRLVYREAKKRGTDILTVAQERANETDKYGGMLCPPDVWAAQLSDDSKDKVHPVLRALSGASQNMATAVKHSQDGDMRYIGLAKELDKLAMEVDAMLEKAEAIK